ncbi:MAG: hypothetical protein WC767_00980 [Candidatus Paceibacterota bacterium]|jgi:hypothetical protein
MHDRSPCQPLPRKTQDPVDWPLLVPAAVIVLGLIALGIYIASKWPDLSIASF